MGRIKAQNLLPLNIKQLKVKPYIFADVNKVQINRYVMDRTVICKNLNGQTKVELASWGVQFGLSCTPNLVGKLRLRRPKKT